MKALCREGNQVSNRSARFDETIKIQCAWTRHCPSCGRPLQKTDPMHPWICECGWQSG